MVTPLSQSGQTQDIEVARLVLAKNAREHSPEKLLSLAADMERKGQLQEIVVVPVGESFEVVSGTGRTLAARQLGWKTIRARVLANLSAFDKLSITFAENEEVEDVSPLYQAKLMQAMLKEGNLKQVELAARLGKDDSYVTHYLRIAELSVPVQENLNRFRFLGLAHLLQICRLEKEQDQIDLSTQCAKQEWSVRELQAEVDLRLKGRKPPTARTPPTPNPLEDPLESVWIRLKDAPLTKEGAWVMEYVDAHAWRLFMNMTTPQPKRAMGEFLVKLGNELLKQAEAPRDEIAIPTEYDKPTHVPQSPDEWKDFEAAARQGVSSFYAWLYGKDHAYAKPSDVTWEVLGFSSPETGAREMLAAILENRPAKTI